MGDTQNEVQTVKEDQFFHHMDENGDIHVIDILTGDIVRSAPQFEDGLVPGRQHHPLFINGKSEYWKYNPLYRDLICQKIMEGQTFTSIGKTPGFPCSAIIHKWRIQNPEFEVMITAAKRARAENFVDTIIDSLEDTKDLTKEEVPAHKLHLDKLKWLAEKSDPKGYGTRHSAEEQVASQVNMIINTGVPLDDEYNDNVKTIKVTDYEHKGKST